MYDCWLITYWPDHIRKIALFMEDFSLFKEQTDNNRHLIQFQLEN